jgi:hypothetical protein
MVEYEANNAPKEGESPKGVFEFGHHFEDLMEEYLRAVIPHTAHIENPVQISYKIQGVTITGSTDPVVFSQPEKPAFLVEVKTAKNLHYINSPKEQHRAQAHAYAAGLSTHYDIQTPPICYIYGSREDLSTMVFVEDFDPEFFGGPVLSWAQENTKHRKADELSPTVTDKRDYQCDYCDYRDRCGYPAYGPQPTKAGTAIEQLLEDYSGDKADKWEQFSDSTVWIGDRDHWDSPVSDDLRGKFQDTPPRGFLPCTTYPESTVIAHLLTYPDLKLTPTLAAQHPSLCNRSETSDAELKRLVTTYGDVPQRDVYDWVCPSCGETYDHQRADWDGKTDPEDRPQCISCSKMPPLQGPDPQSQ